ncbi:D-alanyl-D-alanine carboxypeptidase family protein [Agromyces atrinae]|uniref:D-alanyl-D-alanine carboxypeptidase n=1 Tax=Agromyces atrinae TaxID=592376 RepID=A0A4V1R2A7_9MICO|nr:D-alanyl-D-alanine carboxypeptidase [Agromyces atrinae]NYD66156.1 D-alanyl-D-alanine carboxypeptidase (penicillin-binding protein 5/6) [Agromyces atrinae]RXZ86496.1 D-alanyl-D-alanine carboxypeptidase [Agromyces atrinae]
MPPTSSTNDARRRIYVRRRIVVFSALALVLALVIGGGVYTSSALAAPVPTQSATVADRVDATQPAVPIAWPDFGRGALGAVGMPGVLTSSGDQGAVPIASITKVVTALVILDAQPLAEGEAGPTIEYGERDADIYYDVIAEGGSVAPVAVGQTLSLRQSLEALLIPSANNYSISLAEWAYGSVDAYLAAARAWLDARGLTDTQLADTSGLDAGNTSTPANLIEIGKLALADPTIASIVAEQAADLPGIGVVDNTNKLLGWNGVDGIKTGTTDEAGACLLFSADYLVGDQTVTVVGVLLGGDTHSELNAAIRSVLESAVPAFHIVDVIAEGDAVATYSTVWGDEATARASTAASVLVWNDTPITQTVVADDITLAAEGTAVGSVQVTAGETTIDVPITLDAAIDDPGFEWRMTHPGGLDG